MFGYPVLLADPPWDFKTWSDKATRSARQHYSTMTLEELKALPVGHLAAKDSLLFLWGTWPLLKESLALMEHWGFGYATCGFDWAKRSPRDTSWHMGPGYYTRANTEYCLIGRMGDPPRPKVRDVRQLVVEPRREHSRKPDRIRSDIERMYEGPYVELFARSRHPGWDAWGNETDRFSTKETTSGTKEAVEAGLCGE